MVNRKRSIRNITAARKTKLNSLAEILYHFLPLSSGSKSTITFSTIFSESSVAHYLEGQRNKLQALEQGLTKVYRYHKRLPSMLIRKIIPASISYRKHIRKPLTRHELNEISKLLEDLGIDMTNEISRIEIDETLPRIKVPPDKLKEALRMHDLDPAISSEPLQLFEDGHFNESVRKAMERYEDLVQEISTLDASGRDLMARVFSSDSYINADDIEPENQVSFTEGYKFLAMGSMGSIRNIFSHGDEESRSPEECFEMLIFINWLIRYLKKD